MSNPSLAAKFQALTARLTGASPLQKKLLGGGMWAVIGKVTLSGGGLALNMILARILSPDEMGAYFIAVSILAVVGVFILLGLNQAIVRLIAEAMAVRQPGRARQAIQWAFTLLLLGCLLGIVFMLLGGGQWITEHIFHSPLLSDLTGLIALWIVFSTFQTLLAEAFRGFQDIRLAASFGGGGALTRILLLIFLAGTWLLRGNNSLRQVILLSLWANIITVLLAATLLNKRLRKLPVNQHGISFKEMLTITAPFWINGLSLLVISQADIWFLGAYQDADQVAIYGAVLRLILLATTPTLISAAVLPPIITELHSKRELKQLESILRSTATLIAIPASVVFVSFLFWGREILTYVYGEYYSSGYQALVTTSLGYWVFVLAGSSGLTLMMSGYQKVIMRITLFTGILSLILMYIFTPRFGYNGLAVVVSITIMLQNLMVLLYVRIKIGIWTHIKPNLLLHPKSFWRAIK